MFYLQDILSGALDVLRDLVAVRGAEQ